MSAASDNGSASAANEEPSTARLLSLLHDGDRCLAEALVSVRRSEKIREVVRQEGQNLVDVLVLMRQQARSLGYLLHWVWDCNCTFLARIDSLLAQDRAFVQIDAICRQLESTKVDSQLVAGEDGHTLFDFVDDTSVSSLKLQAQVDVKEMLAVHERGASLQLVLEERLLYFRHVLASIDDALGAPGSGENSAQGTPLESCGLWRAVEANVVEQSDIIHKMKAGLLSAASAHARVTREMLGHQEMDDDMTLQRVERELLALLQSSIERIKNLHVHIDSLPHRLHTLHQHLWALLADFDSFHPEALERVSGLRAEQVRFRELGENVESHLQELGSLASFYTHFHRAYAQLAHEIPRRRKALEAAAKVVLQAEETLCKLHEEEEDYRTKFYNDFGRYLPASLCPVIQEPPERFHVTPDVQEVLARLPEHGKGTE